ncbi:hypothetical protein I350_01860 [Cryptococcus amylolentus CBS 6273]|uniref:DNA topoisomerase n=1 Tax=Cryptococcus amylolentus CBS 6273 TaxID=1296118 RepID=A0A1E3KAS7_9TREE|nr:hypothetical protein I350_01860 [Cryptococcus amylolentus CBS 6273]
MRVLCVAEKPSIAKSITQILSNGHWNTRNSGHDYIRNYDFPYRLPPPLGQGRDVDMTVTAVLGHLTSSDFDDDHRKWGSCEAFALFEAPIITYVDQKLKSVERNLRNEARNADMLMIWTDCDREGEHIGAEVVEACKKGNPRIVVKRARFSAIIPPQIHRACCNADNLDQRQADAVATRIALDLRIGSAFTRLTTMTLQARIPEFGNQVISYGPCQFPTLGFVVDQYTRVQAFSPEAFWYIHVTLPRQNDNDNAFDDDTIVEFKWKRGHLFDLEVAVMLFEGCAEDPEAEVIKVESKPATKWKPLPLTTVELQQSGSRLLHMTPKQILDHAEKLYQKGFVSYPRTETDQYDPSFDFNSLIEKQTHSELWGDYSRNLLNGAFQRPRNGRKNDKAHPPIHPTAHASPTVLSPQEAAVYALITRRFLASCSHNATGRSTTVTIDIAGELFSTSGLVVADKAYLEVYVYERWEGRGLPDFEEGERFWPGVVELKEGETTRPKLLTEADLVGLMDKNGIGTDATIAQHIATIIEREYVTEKQEARIKYLLPSTLGVGLVEGFNEIGFDRSLSKPHLRRETEHRMKLICEGRNKGQILAQTIDEYKDIFVRARQEFQTITDCVQSYLTGQGEAQQALRAMNRGRGAARGARGAARGEARGARGGAGRGARGGGGGAGRGGGAGGGGGAPRGRGRRDDEEDSDEDSDPGPGRGGGRGRGGAARGRGRGAGTVAPARRARSPSGLSLFSLLFSSDILKWG